MRVNPASRGFSLIEVATSIGVIAFALVALLGVFPLGLENGRLCVGDTRATQLVKMVATTLESEKFTAAECFSVAEPALPVLDLTTVGTEGVLSAAPDAVLYASYDVTALPRLVRAVDVPADAIYRVELRFRREKFKPLGSVAATSRVVGTNVDLRIFGVREKQKKPFSESWIYIPNLPRP